LNIGYNAPVNGQAIAMWNVATDADQLASLTVTSLSHTAVGGDSCGVGVRMSGTHSAFTGYVAGIEYDTSGPTASLVLRKFTGEDMFSSSGTELGRVSLTIPDFTNSNQGDVIEIRAIGSRIEAFIWSDTPQNNLGKAIAVTDSAITSGKFGIYGKVNNTLMTATNFYGRSFE
jgi:hypothetical protein